MSALDQRLLGLYQSKQRSFESMSETDIAEILAMYLRENADDAFYRIEYKKLAEHFINIAESEAASGLAVLNYLLVDCIRPELDAYVTDKFREFDDAGFDNGKHPSLASIRHINEGRSIEP